MPRYDHITPVRPEGGLIRRLADSAYRVRKLERAGLSPLQSITNISTEERPPVGGAFMNVDYVVDSNGTGTHKTLFGATGALAEAIATQDSRTIWICTTHHETVVESQTIGELINSHQRILVFSAGRERPIIYYSGTGPLIIGTCPIPSGPVEATFRFQGFELIRTGVGTVDQQGVEDCVTELGEEFRADCILENTSYADNPGPFYRPLAEPDAASLEVPCIELVDMGFQSQQGGTWTYLFDLNLPENIASSRIVLDDCYIQQLASVIHAGPTLRNNVFEVVRCRFDGQLGSLVERVDGDLVCVVGRGRMNVDRNTFSEVLNYLWRSSCYNTSEQNSISIEDNKIVYSGIDSCIEFFPSDTFAVPRDIKINDNDIQCLSLGSHAVKIMATGIVLTTENISIMGNTLCGPSTGIAIVLVLDLPGSITILNTYRFWDSEVSGAPAMPLAVGYAPVTLTDWEGSADPVSVGTALDQVARRLRQLEGIGFYFATAAHGTSTVLNLTVGTPRLNLGAVGGAAVVANVTVTT